MYGEHSSLNSVFAAFHDFAHVAALQMPQSVNETQGAFKASSQVAVGVCPNKERASAVC